MLAIMPNSVALLSHTSVILLAAAVTFAVIADGSGYFQYIHCLFAARWFLYLTINLLCDITLRLYTPLK